MNAPADPAALAAAINAGLDDTPAGKTADDRLRLRFDLAAETFDAGLLTGPPPPPRWLVPGLLPLGVPALLAAPGGCGKSLLALDLGLRVSCGDPGDEGPDNAASPFGAPVATRGAAVVLTAEDTQDELHRRLHLLDPGGVRRRAADHRLIVVALPNAGGPFPLVREGRDGPVVTPEAEELAQQLLAVRGLALVVVDPLQVFAGASLNEPEVAQGLSGYFARLCAETDATALVLHHMRKDASSNKKTAVEAAREAIRGTTGLVDGVRCALAMWPENDAVQLAVVKSNQPATREVLTLRLVPDRGFKRVVTAGGGYSAADLATLEADIAWAAARRQPFSVTGANGVTKGQLTMLTLRPDLLRERSVRAMVDALIKSERVRLIQVRGREQNALDVAGGLWATADETPERRQGERLKRPADWQIGMPVE